MVEKADAATDRLHIRLLGDLELRRGTVVLPLPPSRRTRALLGYLVATALPQTRTALCDLLWEGPDDPRASLRWSLTKLRAVVDEAQVQRLIADRDRVGFQALRCEVDTQRLSRLLEGGIADAPVPVLEEAAACLQREFLDGLDLPACYRFQHWCMSERERLGDQRRAVLGALVKRLEGDPQRALPYGHAMVAADPLAELPHATLVRLLAAAGRYPEAERHYEWARDLLRREIALNAGGVLDDAIHRARREQREAPLVLASKPPPPTTLSKAGTAVGALPAVPALVGRETQLEAIASALQVRAGRRASLLLFAGEPGVGKSRMLDHLAQQAAASGYRIIRARCFESETVRPYGVWLDALRGVTLDGVPVDLLEATIPLLAGEAGAEGGSRERMIEAAAALIHHLAGQQALVLLVDDLQWIDEGSAALLHYLARTLADAPIVLATAARTGEIDDNTGARSLVQSLTREGGLQRLELGPLNAAQARTLLAETSLDADEAVALAGGNPLYLIELARAAHRAAPHARQTPGAGRTLEGLIDERLDELDEPARDLLAWAAAFGGELRPDLLAEAAGMPVAEVLGRLTRIERRGLVITNADGEFDFAHGLVRQGVYRALSQPRRRALHRQIARVLSTASAQDPGLHGEIVHHASLAGEVSTATRACLAAGEHCLRVYANVQAAQVAERGLAQVTELPHGVERVRLEIGLLRLRVAAAAGPGGQRLPALAERIEQATLTAQALSLHADAAAGWEILAFWRQRASDTGLTEQATLAAERMTRGTDATTRCLQLANTGRCLIDIEADVPRGRALLEEAAALADDLGLDVMEIDWGRGLLARADGDLDGAAASLQRAVTLARLAGNHWREYECMVWLATVAFEQGRHADVLQHVEAIGVAATRMGESRTPVAQALAALTRLREHDSSGHLLLAASLDELRALDDKAHLAYVLNEAAALALAAGRLPDASTLAGEALAAALAVRRPTEVTVALARLGCAAQDPVQAAGWLGQTTPQELSARAASALDVARRTVPTIAPTSAS